MRLKSGFGCVDCRAAFASLPDMNEVDVVDND